MPAALARTGGPACRRPAPKLRGTWASTLGTFEGYIEREWDSRSRCGSNKARMLLLDCAGIKIGLLLWSRGHGSIQALRLHVAVWCILVP